MLETHISCVETAVTIKETGEAETVDFDYGENELGASSHSTNADSSLLNQFLAIPMEDMPLDKPEQDQ